MIGKLILVVLALTVAAVIAEETRPAVRALVKTCPGCSLNRMPQLKSFLKTQASDYENLSIEWIGGHKPTVYLFDENNNEITSRLLSEMTGETFQTLVNDMGLPLRKKGDTPVFEQAEEL